MLKKDITCWNKSQITQFLTDEIYKNVKNELTPISTEISEALLCEDSEEVAVYIAGYAGKQLSSKINGSSSTLFLFASKKQLIIFEDNIEKKLQIGRRQLNDMRYNMHKKNYAWSPHLCLNIEDWKAHIQKNS